jgi:CrcB protein
LARVALARLLPPATGALPWATLLANLTGSFALAFALVLLLERGRPRPYARLFLGVGVLGGYTTFSTLAVETDLLVRDGHLGTAAAYLSATLVLGLGAGWAGLALGRALPGVRLDRRERP